MGDRVEGKDGGVVSGSDAKREEKKDVSLGTQRKSE